MNVKEQLDQNLKFFEHCMDVMVPKSYDYATDDIVFVEMFRQAWEMNITPQKVMWILIRKHLTAVKEFINNQKVKSESIDSRLIDVANQMALLHIMINKEQQLCEDISDYVLEHEDCERPNSEQSCLLLETEDKCERCDFLTWITSRYDSLVSKATLSESTLKQLDFSRGQLET
tara:strand:- start:345 stop:866 length:522 start_codon:yes stop_codon:yes gene_type:complete